MREFNSSSRLFLVLHNLAKPRLFFFLSFKRNKKKKVDRTNFEQGLAALRAALAAGDFYALDCEFTGIDNNDGNGNKRRGGSGLPPFRPPSCVAALPPTSIDDPEERYPALASAASRFSVSQVGVAVFEWVRRGDGSGGSYRAHCFNCWTFPSSPSSSSSSSSSSSASRAAAASAFQCTPGSLSFLSSAGFDFNRWIGKGIPSCSARERDELLAWEEARKGGGGVGAAGGGDNGGGDNGGGGEYGKNKEQQQLQQQRPPIVPTSPYDISLVEETVSRVSQWLSEGENASSEPVLRLKGGNAFQRALVYQTLERGEELASLRFHPGTNGEDARFVAKTLWPDEEEAFFAEVVVPRQRGERSSSSSSSRKRRLQDKKSLLLFPPLLMLPLLLLFLLLVLILNSSALAGLISSSAAFPRAEPSSRRSASPGSASSERGSPRGSPSSSRP